ncbi:MAG: pyridoxal-phosphate dependent enzyme [Thalassobaculum sp.]|uniref:threonine ammonia-lyase n=1 Tax=Thalassobaculum sp. TaxID=2022740 RepID=UPI0032EDDEFC
MTTLVTVDAVHRAAAAIAGHVLRTPSVDSPGLAALLGRPVALKLEILQMSGCFKPRGIVNKVLSLTEAERARGLLTVTGGNHGIALALIARRLGLQAVIVMPAAAPERSKARVRADGAELIEAPDVTAAFAIADEQRARGLTYLHAYDDPVIVAGHGTVGLEFAADVPDLTDVLVSIGGGALSAGVAVALKAANPAIRVWGVETEGADAMTRALAAGAPVPIRPTSISSTLGAPVVSELTLAHARELLEDVLVVPDAEAVAGTVALAEEARCWTEPAAGCLVPAARTVIARTGGEGRPAARLGLVLCGGNATVEQLAGWRQRFGV